MKNGTSECKQHEWEEYFYTIEYNSYSSGYTCEHCDIRLMMPELEGVLNEFYQGNRKFKKAIDAVLIPVHKEK